MCIFYVCQFTGKVNNNIVVVTCLGLGFLFLYSLVKNKNT